jgi:hypothetical protein
LPALLLLLASCEGPGPLTPAELRWRWHHGTLLEVTAVANGVDVVVACPKEHGAGVVARFRVLSREVREFERRDPLGRRDTLAFIAWRRCQEAAELAGNAP